MVNAPASPSALAASQALHTRTRGFIAAYARGEAMPEPFDRLAADLAAFQAEHVPGYARLCAARGVDPRSIATAADAPAVPTDAFKLARVFAFDPAAAAVTFRTSGTTLGAGTRGAHPMRDVASYDAAALAFGRTMLARGLTGASPVLVIGPSEEEAPDSSLAHMCALFVRAFGVGSRPGETYFVRAGRLEARALRERIAGLAPGVPALVLATSFGLVHWLDALAGDVAPLPVGSRVMQTGGYKGKSREVSAPELRRAVARAFALDERTVIAEYGMTELSSQFWEATLVDPAARHGVFVEPPWARVVPVDPETGAPVAAGEVGIARIEDLANVDSAFAVLTQDRVRRVPGVPGVPGGFELLGRAAGAPPRGCSIALDEMLCEPEGP
jgi:hypothetical protein